MSLSLVLRRSVCLTSLAVAMIAGPTLAFQPTVTVVTGGSGEDLTVTDLWARGGNIAGSVDWTVPADHVVAVVWSTDHGASWSHQEWDGLESGGARDSRVTICDGYSVMIYRAASADPNVWSIETLAHPLAIGLTAIQGWTGSDGARRPDIACVANDELATAWFKPAGSVYHVRVRTGRPTGSSTTPQSFDLGRGSASRGLSIATSSHRVYVTWFDGSKLKLRRFNIRNGSSHDLTTLGTSTIANIKDGYYPQIGVDGERVVVSYMDRASLKVRRSGNEGGSFGAAKTLRPEPFPSEIGAFPLNVAVHGSKVAIGAVESSPFGGRGLGYLSTDGGSSYTKVSQHSSGRIAAGLVKVGSNYKYAEAYDRSIVAMDPLVRFRRQ
jgi:hypothetical protein